jgi:multidrug efflux pump subunit AcrA (membrane-fusion protein)
MNSTETSADVIPVSVARAPASDSGSSSENATLHIVANAAGAILILALGIVGFLFFGRTPEVPTDTSGQDVANVAPLVDVANVKAWDQPFHFDIDGEASTYRILTVGAEVTGRVLDKPETTRSGTFVQKGDLLFEIDPVNYQLEEQRLKARVDQAREELKAADVDIQNASLLLKLAVEENQLQQNHLERVRSSFERKAASESDMDTARRQELTSRNALQSQENQLKALSQLKKTRDANLKLAEAELERTSVDLQRCRILAPITGRIIDDMKEEGDYVKPGDALVHVSDSSRMEIKCSLKAEELAWVWQQGLSMNPDPIATSNSVLTSAAETNGKRSDPMKIPPVSCEIAFEFQGVETVWDGYLSRYEGTGVDRATRMFPCRVIVEEPQKTRVRTADGRAALSPPTLLSGMYVTVRIPITSSVPLLEVPAEAVRPGEQLWIVRDGKLKIVTAELVRVDGDSALLRQQNAVLKAGDQIVTSPLASVSDGMAVTTHDVGLPAKATGSKTSVASEVKE